MFDLSIFENFDLFSVGIAISSSLILGFIIYVQDSKSLINRAFLFFVLSSSAWGIVNYLFYKLDNFTLSLWFVRLVMFFAVWQAFTFLQLTYVFPGGVKEYPFWMKKILFPGAILVSAITLTPLVFEGVIDVTWSSVPDTIRGPALPIFGIFSVGLVVAGVIFLIKKIIKTKKESRGPFRSFILGMVLMFGLIIIFNFILPVFYHDVARIPLGALFILPFTLATSFAIRQHGLLNVKILGTEILTFVLATATLFEVILSDSVVLIVFRSSLFLLVLSIGLLLIKSVKNEIQAREKVIKLAKSLEKANLRLQELDRQKTEFLSIASHQLRTPMSIIKGYIELIQDGAYGKISKQTFKILSDMDETNERLVKLIDEFLDISRIEQGRTKFNFEKTDYKEMISSVVDELTQRATDKGLKLSWKPGNGKAEIVMDEEKVRHIVFNFIDNAIKYSQKGTIKVELEKESDGYSVRVKDQGIGFDKIDEANFFQKFYRGKNVKTANVGGTGLGIYVTKKFAEKHGGRVWAHSQGLGKGGEFGVWLPLNLNKENTFAQDNKINDNAPIEPTYESNKREIVITANIPANTEKKLAAKDKMEKKIEEVLHPTKNNK